MNNKLYEEYCIVNANLLPVVDTHDESCEKEWVDPLMNVIGYISKMEGFKTRCKNLHWAAPKNNIHVRLDEFLDEMSEFEDIVAEGTMGILGKFGPNSINGEQCDANNAGELIDCVRNETIKFYDSLPEDSCWKGISSECETFIQNVNKYVYLFSLTDFK